MRVVILTSPGRSGAARVATESVLRWHPDAAVEVVDTGPTGDIGALGGIRHADVVAAAGLRWARWAALPSIVLARLAHEPLLVLSDAAFVAAPLDSLIERAAVDPASVTVVARHGARGMDLGHGGLVADVVVGGHRSGDLLRWWSELAATRFFESDTDLGADPWVGFLVGGERVHVASGGSWRLGPWIQPNASVEANATGLNLDGELVRLAHFPGFDPTEPWWWPNGDDKGVPLSVVPAVRELCRSYGALFPNSEPDVRDDEVPYAQLSSRPGVRRRFRRELLAASEHRAPSPPNPLLAAESDAVRRWLRTAGSDSTTGLSRLADVIWEERFDLHAVFPGVKHRNRAGFAEWLQTYGVAEGEITPDLLPDVAAAPAVEIRPGSSADLPGVNLVGYHRAELGLGVAVRRVAAALEAAGIPWTAIDYDRTDSRLGAPGPRHGDGALYDVNLVLVTPDQLGWFVNDAGPELFAGRYTIGLWYWETDTLPERARSAVEMVDEIWAATRYLETVFSDHTTKPVTLMPVPLVFAVPERGVSTRTRLGLDDRFTYLFTFDFLSTMRRKNPLGVVEAYRRAFPVDDGSTRLVLKSINGDLRLREAEELADAISDRGDIELWDRYLSPEDRLALVATADCYVSLHRSEGLGLTMAEAMWVGTPVIATAYSGNLDFMPEGAALLVPSDGLVEVGPGLPYPADSRWASPSLDAAAAHLRSVRDDVELRERLRRKGREALDDYSLERVGAAMAERLHVLRSAGYGRHMDVAHPRSWRNWFRG